MNLTEFFTGETDTSAQDLNAEQNRDARRFIQEKMLQATEDAQNLFQGAQEDIATGRDAALEILAQVLPQQMQMTQAANRNQQGYLDQAVGDYTAALMGQEMGPRFSPEAMNYDLSFLETRSPPSSISTLIPQQDAEGNPLEGWPHQRGTASRAGIEEGGFSFEDFIPTQPDLLRAFKSQNWTDNINEWGRFWTTLPGVTQEQRYLDALKGIY